MFRLAVCSLLLASVASNRIQIHEAKSKFGATCEDLQVNFHNRVVGLQTVLDAHPDDSTMSRLAQARFSMRILGITRTLRRARTCSWVVDGDSEDIEQMRGIVQVMLAGNPCAQAARAELDAGASDSDESVEVEAVQRAMTVLASENCEVALPSGADGPTMNMDDEAEQEVQMDQAEQQAQDSVDELMDEAMGEESSSFVETDSKGRFGGFFRSLGVIILFLLLLMACTVAIAWIGAIIGIALLEIGILTTCRGGFCGLEILFGGAMIGGVLGLGGCAYTLVTQLLPAVEVSPANALH